MKVRQLSTLVILTVASLVLVLAASAADRHRAVTQPPAFTPAQTIAPSADDWIGYNGNGWNQRFSTLNEITTSNVKKLKIAFTDRLTIPGLKLKAGAFGLLSEQTPVEYQGALYMPDANNNVWAFNATTGERLWVHQSKPLKGFNRAVAGINGIPSRGVAIGDGKVYIGDGDATISALDSATGRVVWKKAFGDWKKAYFFSNAVLYYDGMLITGQSGGDGGAACKVLAIDAKTGKLLWSFATIPLKPGTSATPRGRSTRPTRAAARCGTRRSSIRPSASSTSGSATRSRTRASSACRGRSSSPRTSWRST